MTVSLPRHSGQSATVRDGLTGPTLPSIGDAIRATKRRLREQLSGSVPKMLTGVSPCEDPNEVPYPRVRESIERMLGNFVDRVFGLVLVFL
jgi:hypothetical protein